MCWVVGVEEVVDILFFFSFFLFFFRGEGRREMCIGNDGGFF